MLGSRFYFEFFIAFRYLFSRRKQTFIYIISLMSILGVALGVAALVVVLGVYNGFTTDIKDKILGANAHVIVMSHLPWTLDNKEKLLAEITQYPGVKEATPFLYSEVMLSSPNGVKGLVLRGIDPNTAPKVLQVLNLLVEGSIDGLKDEENSSGIIIGFELAKRLSLKMGDRVNLLSPSGTKTTSGFSPKIRAFSVAGIFKTGMFEYDSSLGFISLDKARNVLGLSSNRISGIEVTVDDVYNADKIAAGLADKLGNPFYVRHWMEMNANLFAALKLEKIGMFILLTMIVLISSFSIVTSLVMMVMEKTRDIAIMMSMGATRGMIRRIFMLQGTIIGIIGTMTGYVLGFSLAALLKKYQFIKLPQGVYTLDHLPIIITVEDSLIIGVSAMLICFLATIYPSRQAAFLNPVDALRYE